MTLYINSKQETVPDTVNTVAKLLNHLGIKPNGTGVGINNRLIVSRNWETTTLQEDDHVMIISAAYGG